MKAEHYFQILMLKKYKFNIQITTMNNIQQPKEIIGKKENEKNLIIEFD